MSKFLGRRYIIDGYSSGGVTDHGMLTGLLDDDHPQYLIVSSIRSVDNPTSGINKTGTGPGDIFSLINAGSSAALYIRQSATTNNADAAVDIDNSGNIGRGLSVSTETSDALLPLVQFSALSQTFGQPVLLITSAIPRGLALSVYGDGYLTGQLAGPEAITFTPQNINPIAIGQAGIYSEGEPGIFYYVDANGKKYTFGDSRISAGCNINIDELYDGYKQISVDVMSLAGAGLEYDIGPDGCGRLKVSMLDGYTSAIHIRKIGYEAEDYPLNTVYRLDGYEYPINTDRVFLYINGIAQFSPSDFTELSSTTIQLNESCDVDDILDILLFPEAFSAVFGSGGITDLQGAYNNSDSGAKIVDVNDGQIVFIQSQPTGSALRLASSISLTPTLTIDQLGTGEAARFKSASNSSSVLLLQKDVSNRNAIQDSIIIERTTTSILGGQTGIGSAILTRLENKGTVLFPASRIITGTEDVTDSTENSYLAIELIDDGTVYERLRLTSVGNLGIGTNAPTATLHVNGDGYISSDLEVAQQIKIDTTTSAPLNVPILPYDPPIIKDGDVWITDIGGIRKINVQINSIVYSVLLTI